MKGIKPLGNRVLIQKDQEEGEKKLSSGIYLSGSEEKGESNQGKVIAVGDGKREEDGSTTAVLVKVGDKVIFSWGEKIEIGGEKYELVSEDNILAIIK